MKNSNIAIETEIVDGSTVETAVENALETMEHSSLEMDGKCWEVVVYTENQVGLLNSIAGMFARRNINIQRLLLYPSQIKGVHKFSIRARASEEKIRQVVLQMDKKVDVIKVFCYEHPNHTAHEIVSVEQFLSERDK